MFGQLQPLGGPEQPKVNLKPKTFNEEGWARAPVVYLEKTSKVKKIENSNRCPANEHFTCGRRHLVKWPVGQQAKQMWCVGL